MKAERTKKINENVIEEYYWGWEFVVYVNNRLYRGTFEDAVREFGGIEGVDE